MERNIIECGGFFFIHNFDSGNLGHVERVPTDCIVAGINHKTNSPETPDYEFNLWTRPDCAGTEFENGNRTWFYFGIQAPIPNCLVRLNLINLNKQGKMYNQGMAPVTRTLPGKPHWERIRDRPIHSTDENMFTLSFKYRTSENVKATTFFAFTYPYSYAELQIALNTIDSKILPLKPPQSPDDIYYCRECLIYSLEGRRVDLLTISSHHGITKEREERLKNLFPEKQERPFKFQNKKVIFVSARVHPGETPSSFVFNGFLNLLLNKTDPVAIQLRKIYVFKLIPFLNPDGVARGHYRTDTRGVNLNRVYLNPSLLYHPTVYASRALIRYYHYGCEKDDSYEESCASTKSIQNVPEDIELFESNKDKKKSATARSGDVRKRQTKSAGTDQREDTLPPFRRENVSSDLTGQVYDLKLNQEIQCQTSESSFVPSPPSDTTTSCLTDDALRTCLGSSVHVSTSEELNIQGGNPLRPLRDTLKNSISLLMESGTTVTGDSSMVSRVSAVRVGWCAECRRAAARLDATHPPALPHPASVTTHLVRPESPTVYHSIEEYRDRQQQKFLDDQEIKTSDKPQVYFCTNCFKRYYNNEDDEHWWVGAEGGGRAGSPARTPSATGDSPPPPPPLALSTSTSIQQGTEATSTVCPAAGSRSNRPARPAAAAAAGPAPRRKPTHPPAATTPSLNKQPSAIKEPDSGLYLYLDLHGHASKKGIFMYGNHFPDVERSVECMLLPRLMSLNNLHFHFSSCNFTERNMYLKDRRDGMSREGSGRVAVLKATGLVRSYTLECNYNTGRLVNVLPPPRAAPPALAAPAGPAHTGPAHAGSTHTGPAHAASPDTHHPPNYNPHIYEEVGKSLGASILDLTGSHPNSRVPSSEHRTVGAIREWLRAHSRTLKPQFTMSRLRPKILSPTRAPLYPRSKGKMPEERKENAFSVGREPRPIDSSLIKLAKKTDSKPPSRFLSENEPKAKSMTSKRRSILAIRKPNTSKTQVTGVVKKSRGRSETAGRRVPAAASSSSSSGSARRRPPHAHHAPNALKKIRLNTSA